MAKNEDKDEDIEVQEQVVEGETVVLDEDEAKKGAQAATGDERVGTQEADAEDVEDAGASEEVRAARRLERKQKKERQRAAQDRNRKELNFLRQRNDDLERRLTMTERRVVLTEASSIDDRISQTDQQLRVADEVIAAAIKNNEGQEAVEAENIRDRLREHKKRLLAHKERLASEDQQQRQPQQGQVQQQQQQQPQVDPDLIKHADAWMRKNTWFDPGRGDDDSAIVSALDERLASEGYDPASQEYWEELTDRARKVLPHRFQQQQRTNGNGQGQERRGPQMANGARERTLGPGQMYVSAERKQALMDAGVWDDAKVRNRYLKRYEQYDREKAAADAAGLN